MADYPPDDIEFLDVGPSREPRTPPRQRRPRWRLRLLAAAALASVGVVVIVTQQHGSSHPAARDRGPTTASTPPLTTSHSTTVSNRGSLGNGPPQHVRPVAVTELGRRLLGVDAPWQLYGRADSAVVRIQLARGRVTTTAVPPVATTGLVSFVAGARVAIVRPYDPATGYAVFDGRPARPLSGELGQGGPAFPGPDARHIWIAPGSELRLATFSGRTSGTEIPIPAGDSVFDAVADGTGHLLFPAVGGIYDANPGHLHRITTGALAAVGPTGWLVQECDQADRCALVYIDRVSEKRHRIAELGGTAQNLPIGTISPTGTTAALFLHGPNGGLRIGLVSLPSGRRHLTRVIPADDTDSSTVVWAPDGSRLFALNCTGRLFVVDARTGRAARMDLRLPALLQLAISGTPTR